MQDPQLPSRFFVLDRVLVREPLFPGRGPIRVSGASHDGESLVVRSQAPAAVALVLLQRDLSRFTDLALTVANCSSVQVLVGMRLVHGTYSQSRLRGNPAATDAMHCWTSRQRHPADTSFSGGREPLSPHGRREIRFPCTAFGNYGHPLGWTDVERIEIILAHEKDHVGPRDIDAVLECLVGETREVPQGPRLTSDGLTHVLSKSALDPANSWFLQPLAVLEAEHCRTSRQCHPPGCDPENPGMLIPPPHSYPQESAEEILSGRIMGRHLGEPIPWDANPPGELEWGHFLHRHHFMKTLARRAITEKDAQCVKALDRMLAHWIVYNPVPVGSNGGAGPAWETLTAAWRLREWLWIVGAVWCLPGFTGETRELVLRSVWEHAQHLRDHQGHPNNWLIVESAALMLAGLCFPEFPDAAQWAGTGLERLQTQVARQFYPDGVHFEISPLYHALCVHACLDVVQVCRAVGHTLPDGFETIAERAVEYLAAVCRPDFTWPSINDSGGAAGDYTALLLMAGEIFGRDDFTWIGTRGHRGAPPARTFHTFPDAGIVVMRSAWERDAHQLVLRGGPPGFSHVHGDVLSLDVTTHGTIQLVDPGIGTYAPGVLTDHYRSAGSHTMILVDDEGPARLRVPLPERIRSSRDRLRRLSGSDWEEVTAFCDGPWGSGDSQISIARTVRFVSKRYWIVRDTVQGTGVHTITTCWQFGPGYLVVDPVTGAARKVDGEGNALTLLPLPGTPVPAIRVGTGESDPPMGWVSLHGADIPATMVRHTVEAELPVTLVWLLVPAAAGQTHRKSEE